MTKKLEDRVTVLETTVGLQYPTIVQGINEIRKEMRMIYESINANSMGIQKNMNGLSALKEDVEEHKTNTIQTLRELKRDSMQTLVKWAAAITAICTAVATMAAAMFQYGGS